MFFDTLAGIVERHLPEFTGRMKAASLFRIEGKQTESVEATVSDWEPDAKTIENFRLPFPTLFLEYADSRNSPSYRGTLLFVEDAPTRRLGFLTGSANKDGTADIGAGSIMALPNAEDGYIPETRNQQIAVMKTAMRLWTGDKKSLRALPMQLDVEAEVAFNVREGLHELVMPRDKEKIVKLLSDAKLSLEKTMSISAYLSCGVAVLSVLIINEPGSFIVEERPLLPTGEPKHLAIPRAPGRPHYIVLKPRQIRERFIYPDRGEDPEADEVNELARRKVGAHERRGHYRRLSAERFKAARGRVIWIDPIWVGPSEAVRGPNRYKVRLDL